MPSPEKPEEKVEPPPEPQPEPKPSEEPRPPAIDGVLAKDGKNVIPYSVLEEERTKRQAAEAEVAELRKKPAEPKPEAKLAAKPLPQPDPAVVERIERFVFARLRRSLPHLRPDR